MMLNEEHLEAWRKIKKHLDEHESRLQDEKQPGNETDIDLLISDIHDSVNVIEEVFICSLG